MKKHLYLHPPLERLWRPYGERAAKTKGLRSTKDIKIRHIPPYLPAGRQGSELSFYFNRHWIKEGFKSKKDFKMDIFLLSSVGPDGLLAVIRMLTSRASSALEQI